MPPPGTTAVLALLPDAEPLLELAAKARRSPTSVPARVTPVYTNRPSTPPWHPTRALANVLTIKEHCDKPWADICLAYVGDGQSNVANSLRIAGALLGMTVRVVAPATMSGSPDMRDQVERIRARTGGGAEESDEIDEGVRDADFVYADTWSHLGEPVESWRPRVAALAPYRVDSQVLAATKNPPRRPCRSRPVLPHRSRCSCQRPGRPAVAPLCLRAGQTVTVRPGPCGGGGCYFAAVPDSPLMDSW
ncbi:hypothetical protein [Streptomyces alboniger]